MMRNLALIVTTALCAFGCDYGDSSNPVGQLYPPPTARASVPIDTDAELASITAGSETGLFVEYRSGGRWRIYMVCDYDVSGVPCEWDVIAAPRDGVIYELLGDGTDGEDLLTSDRLLTQANLLTLTYSDFDGMFVDTNPGVAMVVDVFLDGGPAPDLVFWVSDGASNPGAPDNPIEFVPTSAVSQKSRAPSGRWLRQRRCFAALALPVLGGVPPSRPHEIGFAAFSPSPATRVASAAWTLSSSDCYF